MTIRNWGHIQPGDLDVFKELGNIGAGNAATALSSLMEQSINMRVPSASLLPFDDISAIVGGPEHVVVSIYFRILGDISGSMFFILDRNDASTLLISMGVPSSDQSTFTELEYSALKEVGNILCGSFLTAIADFLKIDVQPSVPSVSVDMAAATLSVGLIEVGLVSDWALMIDTQFLQEARAASPYMFRGHFLLLPDPTALQMIFTALGVSNDDEYY